jgi:hypothetical protein
MQSVRGDFLRAHPDFGVSMRKTTFGRRQGSKGPQDPNDPRPHAKYTKIDFVRGVIAATVHHYQNAPTSEKDGLAMRIRVLQDQIASLKRLTATLPQPTPLDWVDSWRPD